MSVSMRTTVLAAATIVALALAGGVAVDRLETAQPSPGTSELDSGAPLFEPRPNESAVWPYTSRARSVESRTLAINVVIHGDPAAVRHALTRRTDASWNPPNRSIDDGEAAVEPVEAIAVNGTALEWTPARGSTRYTFITTGSKTTTGRWVTESYQLHVGDYLGSRYHIRAYTPERSAADWTALQAHHEHWDWFRLRHTVGGTEHARNFVEADFRDESFVREVRRTWTGARWMTEIELVSAGLAVLAFGLSSRDLFNRARGAVAKLNETVDPVDIALFGAPLALYLGVRLGGVTLERTFPGIAPKVFAGALYLVIAAGLPLVVAILGRRTDPLTGFAAGGIGLGTAFVVDYAYLGITALPVDVALHRVAAIVALGLVAAGAASSTDGERDGWLLVGVAGWIAVLAVPLFGLL